MVLANENEFTGISVAEPENDAEFCKENVAFPNEFPFFEGVRYRRSFLSKLIQSDPSLKEFYQIIKNLFLSYRGVRSRISFGAETFKKGRIHLARLNVKGKGLTVELSLDPRSYPVGKYHFTDQSTRCAEMPMLMRVRSPRSLRCCLALIEEQARLLLLEKDEGYASQEYELPYETNEALIARGLIKVIPASALSRRVPDSEVGSSDNVEIDAFLADDMESAPQSQPSYAAEVRSPELSPSRFVYVSIVERECREVPEEDGDELQPFIASEVPTCLCDAEEISSALRVSVPPSIHLSISPVLSYPDRDDIAPSTREADSPLAASAAEVAEAVEEPTCDETEADFSEAAEPEEQFVKEAPAFAAVEVAEAVEELTCDETEAVFDEAAETEEQFVKEAPAFAASEVAEAVEEPIREETEAVTLEGDESTEKTNGTPRASVPVERREIAEENTPQPIRSTPKDARQQSAPTVDERTHLLRDLFVRTAAQQTPAENDGEPPLVTVRPRRSDGITVEIDLDGDQMASTDGDDVEIVDPNDSIPQMNAPPLYYPPYGAYPPPVYGAYPPYGVYAPQGYGAYPTDAMMYGVYGAGTVSYPNLYPPQQAQGYTPPSPTPQYGATGAQPYPPTPPQYGATTAQPYPPTTPQYGTAGAYPSPSRHPSARPQSTRQQPPPTPPASDDPLSSALAAALYSSDVAGEAALLQAERCGFDEIFHEKWLESDK